MTIAGPTCLEADAAGTALFGAPAGAIGRRLARIAPDLEIVHSV